MNNDQFPKHVLQLMVRLENACAIFLNVISCNQVYNLFGCGDGPSGGQITQVYMSETTICKSADQQGGDRCGSIIPLHLVLG